MSCIQNLCTGCACTSLCAYYSSFSTSLPSQTPQVVNIRGFDASSCAKTKEILHSKTHGFPHDFPDIPVDHQTRAYTMCRAAHSTVHSTVLRWTPPLSALPRNHQVPSIPAKDVAAWPHTRDKTLSVEDMRKTKALLGRAISFEIMSLLT